MRYLLVGLFLLLTACGGPQSTARTSHQALQKQIGQLPGVTITNTAPLSFSYPEQVMFGSRSVLPMPGGPKLLNPLVDFLRQNPQLPWLIDVRAQTTYGAEYDQLLAEKRSELLATYLLNKGVKLQNLHFQPSAAEGDQLVFTLKQDTIN